MVIEVGYWNLRGLVGFIRLLDVHTDEGIQWRTYETSKSAEWFDEKAKLIETGEIGKVKYYLTIDTAIAAWPQPWVNRRLLTLKRISKSSLDEGWGYQDKSVACNS